MNKNETFKKTGVKNRDFSILLLQCPFPCQIHRILQRRETGIPVIRSNLHSQSWNAKGYVVAIMTSPNIKQYDTKVSNFFNAKLLIIFPTFKIKTPTYVAFSNLCTMIRIKTPINHRPRELGRAWQWGEFEKNCLLRKLKDDKNFKNCLAFLREKPVYPSFNKSINKLNMTKQLIRPSYLILCKLDDSLIVGNVARSLSVGRRWRRVRLDNFQTRRWRWATVHSPLYLSNWPITTPKQLMKLSEGIWK